MKVRTLILSTGIALAISLSVLGSSFASEKSKSSQPTRENFEKALSAIWEAQQRPDQGRIYSSPQNKLCIQLATYPLPDKQSGYRAPMAWSIGFALDSESNQLETRRKLLRQLNALSRAGLLQKTTERMPDRSTYERFSLTEIGWGASDYDSGFTYAPCFIFGMKQFLGVTKFEQVDTPGNGGKGYLVYGKVGLNSEAEIATWANAPDVILEFPEVTRAMVAQEIRTLLVLGSDGWIEFSSSGKADQDGPGNGKITQKQSSEMKKAIADLEKLPLPTVKEVEKAIERIHAHSPNCLYLPDASSRRHNDLITQHRLSYKNTFEALGALVKRVDDQTPAKIQNGEMIVGKDIYELLPPYLNELDRTHGCFSLGQHSVKIVDIQISNRDAHGFPTSTFQYKARLINSTPPSWMKNPLAQGWPELRGSLERGRACQGKFEFNKNTRETGTGIGSCWWAFESYENP